MRIEINQRWVLFFAYVLMIFLFMKVQSETGPFEQSIRARAQAGEPVVKTTTLNP